MTLRPLTRAARRRAAIQAVVDAYSAWRRECIAVHGAYGRWVRAARRDSYSAFVAYRVALDREERAADMYVQLLSRAQRQSGAGLFGAAAGVERLVDNL